MTTTTSSESSAPAATANVGAMLVEQAAAQPHARALSMPGRYDRYGRREYASFTFEQLNADSDRIAWGLQKVGLTRGMRTLLAIKPSLEFISVTFALFKLGAVPVLIDPGMGKGNLLNCIKTAEPKALIAVSAAHAVRVIFGGKAFASVEHNITVGSKWFWGGTTLDEVRELGKDAGRGEPFPVAETAADELAAILFTTGATGPPKGVEYEHGMFRHQIEMLRERFGIGPGDVDLPGFPLFALFSTALGAAAVIPDMDPTRPAQVDPKKWCEAMDDQGVTYSFGSPAIWRRVTQYCLDTGRTMPNLRLVLMAGAPVPPELFARFDALLPKEGAEAVSPYGATESLPTTAVVGREVVDETAAKTKTGGGFNVGRTLPGIDVRVIRISDEPIAQWSDDLLVPTGEPGEICFAGPNVTKRYFRRDEETALAKIAETLPDGTTRIWHRIGDCGTLDEQGRLWFYGRKKHRVVVGQGDAAVTYFSVRCEAIFNEHPAVFRTALVGVGTGSTRRPAIVVECHENQQPKTAADRARLTDELLALGRCSPLTQEIRDVLFHPSFPVDYRHNAKILREKLAVWAGRKLK